MAGLMAEVEVVVVVVVVAAAADVAAAFCASFSASTFLAMSLLKASSSESTMVASSVSDLSSSNAMYMRNYELSSICEIVSSRQHDARNE